MKKVLFLVILGLSIGACRTPKPLEVKPDETKGSALPPDPHHPELKADTLKADTLKGKVFHNGSGGYPTGVHGTVTIASNYCGGAAPSREMEEELARPKPYPGKKLYLRKGKTNDVRSPLIDSVITDAEGKFHLQLKPGDYCLLLPEQKSMAAFNALRGYQQLVVTDEACFKNWFAKGFYTFRVEEDGHSVEFKLDIFRQCFVPEGVDCLDYIGPYPP